MESRFRKFFSGGSGRRTLARMSLWLAVMALPIAAPGGASAATQIGETFSPLDGCSSDLTNLQTTSPGGSYTASSAGVITSWSFEAGTAGASNILKFKVARPVGGDQFADVGQSSLVNTVPGMLNTFLIRVPVQAGDVIGFYKYSGAAGCSKAVAGYFTSYRVGDSGPAPSAFTPFAPATQMDLSATLEPDCDRNGFGDETQEAHVPSCGGQPTAAPAQKKCKKKKKKSNRARKKCRKKANPLPA
jgi:hypothetical protein